MTELAQLPPACFLGVVPATVATASAAGIPNITQLSQIVRVDAAHVALSCQFFNKTKQNVLENPHAVVELYDPVGFDAYRLELSYVRSETEGPLFDAMALRIQAIASHTGMAGVFKLLSAEVFRVTRCELREGFLMPPTADTLDGARDPGQPRSELKALQLVSERTARAPSLDALLTTLLATLEETLGFQHSMLLVPDESSSKLFAVASRGYGEEGIGAEVDIGDGSIGSVAHERRAEIPLAGLVDAESQLAIPLCAGSRLMGVLAVESRAALGFDEWDEAFLEVVGNQVAVAIENVILRERQEDGMEPPPSLPEPSRAKPGGPSCRFRFSPSDDCVFIGDEYLIRNLPGRILWKLLRAYVNENRTQFSNRQLRLDPALGLPAIRDNLESRLVLLRKRLEQKCPLVRIVSSGRGHFRLEVRCAIELEPAVGERRPSFGI